MFDDRYLRINLYVFRVYTDSPLVHRFIRRVVFFLSTTILSLALTCQVRVLFVQGTEIQNIIKVVPLIVTTGTLIVLVLVLHIYKHTYKACILMNKSLHEEKMEGEAENIRKKSAEFTKLLIKVITLVIPLGLAAVYFMTFVPIILDVIIPLNESRPLELTFPGDHFIDEEKYFFFIVVFQQFTSALIVIVAVVTINICIITLRNIITLFEIIGYYFQNVLPSSKDQSDEVEEDEGRLKCSIIFCVKEHKRVLEFVWVANRCADWLLFLELTATFIAITLSLAQVTDPELINLESVLFTYGQAVQFFVISFLGQKVIDSSTNLSMMVYQSRWEDLPTDLQKFYLLIMLRLLEPAVINTKGMFILCHKNFGSVFQSAMSYCMVLRQFR